MRLSVVTRTYCRPLLLRRAARSILAAQIEDMEWIIVDGEDAGAQETKRIADEVASSSNMRVRIVRPDRGGRAAAANVGLNAALGDHVHFHDDDDTVAPGFYMAMTRFLEENSRYKGARCMCCCVYEEISNNNIKFIKKKHHYPERRTVSLFEAAEIFAYPPIGTLLDRQTLIDIGGFNERFEVAEDYDLLLRVLLKADIGTILDTLAYFHVREDATGAYANSPIARNFAEENMLFRNQMLRDDINNNRLGLGWLLALGTMRRNNRSLLDFLDAARKRVGL